MVEKTGRRTVPQIYIDDFHVGGFDDLSALDQDGKLEPMLRGQIIPSRNDATDLQTHKK